MKLGDIFVQLTDFYRFRYCEKEQKYSRLSWEKTQYSYRLIYVERGFLDVCIEERTERLQVGDIVYLTPGTVYRLLPCGGDFSLCNLFFSFLCAGTEKRGEDRTGCVFLSDYTPDLCVPRVEFEDVPYLNGSRFFKGVSCDKAFEDLFSIAAESGLADFYARAKLSCILADMLRFAKREEKSSVAGEILSYVRQNPDKPLSGDDLSKKFSYHKNYINKLVKKETGKSVSEYVRHVKIEHALTLLSEGETPTEIAAALGYYDYSHFYKAFVAQTGVSPTNYKNGGQ